MHESMFPLPLDAYVSPASGSLLDILASRVAQQPINLLATGIFVLAILHTFFANTFRRKAHQVQHAFDNQCRARGEAPRPSVMAEFLHFLGEVEVVFGLWVLVLLAVITAVLDWHTATTYITETVHYTEPMFVVVIMAMAATRPIVGFAQSGLQPPGVTRRVDAGGLVVHHPHRRPAPRLVHHRAGRDDHLRDAARPPVLRAAANAAPALRHAGPAIRQRVDRRHDDALRRPARPDGGTPVGLVAWLHGHALRVEGGAGDRRVQPDLFPRLPQGTAGTGDHRRRHDRR